MSLYLGDMSAWEYLSLHEGEWGLRGEASTYMGDFRSSAPGKFEVEDARRGALSGLASPVHLLVGSRRVRRMLPETRLHLWTQDVPRRGFYRAGHTRDIYVSTPEFAYVQMAHGCDVIQLIARGFEACGTYYVTDRDARGFRKRDALTKPSLIRRLLNSPVGYRGARKVGRSLRYVLPGAASPMETVLTMLLCLPCLLGGYGLPQPQLNHAIAIPFAQRARFTQARFVCDLYWGKARLDVEYDSTMFHAGADEIVRDSKRRDALALLGISVITVTAGQLYDVRELDKVARLVAKRLGRRICTVRTRDWERRRDALRRQLLPGGRS